MKKQNKSHHKKKKNRLIFGFQNFFPAKKHGILIQEFFFIRPIQFNSSSSQTTWPLPAAAIMKDKKQNETGR